MENFNIEVVKRHIKNLIAGNGVSNADMLDLYKNMLNEAIQKRIDKILTSKDMNMVISNLVRIHITKYLDEVIKSEHRVNGNYLGAYSAGIENMVRAECNKQVNEIIKQNLKISFVPEIQISKNEGD